MKRVVVQNPDDELKGQAPTATPSASTDTTPVHRTRPQQGQSLSPELVEILVPSLKVGAVAGACGVFTGAAAGIVRSAPASLFAVIAGGQWFTLGTSYYAARLVGLNYFRQGEKPTPREMVKASTVAGGVAGSLGGLLRGPRNVIPGAVMFSLFGAGGQAIVNWRAARAPQAPPKSSSSFWSRWSPIKALSDQDYVDILEEKLLRVEADIALMDDRIKELRESEGQAKEDGAGEGTSGNTPSLSSKE